MLGSPFRLFLVRASICIVYVRINSFVRLPSTSSRLMPLPSYLWPAMEPRVRATNSSKTMFVTAICAASIASISSFGRTPSTTTRTTGTKIVVQRTGPFVCFGHGRIEAFGEVAGVNHTGALAWRGQARSWRSPAITITSARISNER
jgi:hypothetical protein